jgi:hypothetical protein
MAALRRRWDDAAGTLVDRIGGSSSNRSSAGVATRKHIADVIRMAIDAPPGPTSDLLERATELSRRAFVISAWTTVVPLLHLPRRPSPGLQTLATPLLRQAFDERGASMDDAVAWLFPRITELLRVPSQSDAGLCASCLTNKPALACAHGLCRPCCAGGQAACSHHRTTPPLPRR